MEIVGRHHDPFTVMEQFERPIAVGVYSQPVTDITGALLARLSVRWPRTTGWSFSAFPCRPRPRTCWRVIWRSRRRARRSRRWPTRSPRSIWRTPPITRTSRRHSGCRCTCSRCGVVSTTPRRRRLAFLAPRRSAVTLSNFYGGLIAAVITPVAVAAYWLVARRARHAIAAPAGHHRRRASLLIAAAGIAYASYAAGAVVANRAAFAFPRADLFRYSAKWWSYLVPPVEHPLLGATRASRLECGGRPRGAARTAGEPRLGNRRARAHRRLSVARVRERAERAAGVARARSGPRRRRRRRARLLAVAGADDRRRSPSSGLPRSSTTSCRCSGRTRGSGSSCSSWRRCWRASAWTISAGPGPGARRSRASPSWRSPPASTRSRRRRCGATCCRRRRTAGSCSSPVACGSSTARRSIRSPRRFSG